MVNKDKYINALTVHAQLSPQKSPKTVSMEKRCTEFKHAVRFYTGSIHMVETAHAQ